MKEHYVSFEQAKRLHELGFDGVDKYYVTENFCMGDNPYFFDTFSVGDLVDEHIVYFVNENNEDDYRGIPAPRLDQAAAWLREHYGIHVSANPHSDYSEDADGRICDEWNFWAFDLMSVNSGKILEDPDEMFDSYEEALSAGISYFLKLLEGEEEYYQSLERKEEKE